MTRILLSLSLLGIVASAHAQTPRDTLEAQLAQAPGDAQARRALSDLLVAQGQPAAAVPHLAWLSDHAPRDLALHRRLAQTLLWSDQPARAARVLAEVVALDPADVEARVQIAEIVTWDGGADRAVALLAPVADAHPDDARLHRALAFALIAADDDRARAQTTRALALAPDDAGLLVEGAALERWQGDWRRAQRRLRRALRQPLTDPQRARVQTLQASVGEVSAATVTTTAVRTSDSNGVTRVETPGRVSVPLNGRWTVGAELVGHRIQDATASATGLAVAPLVVFRPSPAFQAEAVAGLAGGAGAALHARVSGQRVWTRRGFALARLTAATQQATEAVDALGLGLRRTSLTAEGYAEPSASLVLNGLLGGLAYSDGNRRVQASLAARWLPVSAGRRDGGAPVASAGLAVGGVYEDAQTVYPDARPYYTPDGLLTTSAGLAVRVAPAPGLRLDGTVGVARQSAGATSLAYGAVAAFDRGPQAVRLEVRRTGSSAYSADVVGLTVRFRLP